MAISPIGSPITPIEFPRLDGEIATKPTKDGGDFASKLAGSMDNLQQLQTKSDDLAMQVATGQLTDIHDYMIASNQAEIATQLTVAVRNKAVESFNSIMNMQV